jgi:hypothetical protein
MLHALCKEGARDDGTRDGHNASINGIQISKRGYCDYEDWKTRRLNLLKNPFHKPYSIVIRH